MEGHSQLQKPVLSGQWPQSAVASCAQQRRGRVPADIWTRIIKSAKVPDCPQISEACHAWLAELTGLTSGLRGKWFCAPGPGCHFVPSFSSGTRWKHPYLEHFTRMAKGKWQWSRQQSITLWAPALMSQRLTGGHTANRTMGGGAAGHRTASRVRIMSQVWEQAVTSANGTLVGDINYECPSSLLVNCDWIIRIKCWKCPICTVHILSLQILASGSWWENVQLNTFYNIVSKTTSFAGKNVPTEFVTFLAILKWSSQRRAWL